MIDSPCCHADTITTPHLQHVSVNRRNSTMSFPNANTISPHSGLALKRSCCRNHFFKFPTKSLRGQRQKCPPASPYSHPFTYSIIASNSLHCSFSKKKKTSPRWECLKFFFHFSLSSLQHNQFSLTQNTVLFSAVSLDKKL